MVEVEVCSMAEASAKEPLEPFKTSNIIGDSPFTVEWVLDGLSTSDEVFIRLQKASPVKNVTATDISHGKGFISIVYKVKIEFEDSKTHTVVLKVPGIESLIEVMDRTAIDNTENPLEDHHISEAHNREVQFYENFAPHIDIPLPKIYKALEWHVGQQHGTILMESFFGKAETMPISIGANVQQLFAMAKHMATLHAYFLTIPPEKWKGKYSSRMFESFSKSDFFGPVFNILKQRKPEMFTEAIEVLGKYRMEKNYLLVRIRATNPMLPPPSHPPRNPKASRISQSRLARQQGAVVSFARRSPSPPSQSVIVSSSYSL